MTYIFTGYLRAENTKVTVRVATQVTLADRGLDDFGLGETSGSVLGLGNLFGAYAKTLAV